MHKGTAGCMYDQFMASMGIHAVVHARADRRVQVVMMYADRDAAISVK